jgi:predicted nucleotidyltransferase
MATIKKEIDQEIVKIFLEHKAELYEKFQVESLAVFGSVSS